MKILVLGSAAGGGFPQWNCNCEGCRRARAGDPLAQARTQSSVAVTADGSQWVLLNASPDLRAQINGNPALHPQRGLRGSPLAAVVLTNADIDHIAGLLTLREAQPFSVYATGRVHDVLASNSVFQVLSAGLVARRPVKLDQPFRPAGPRGSELGIEVEAFAVPGKVALYLEDPSADANYGSRPEDTVALKVTDWRHGKSFFYVPGCASMPDWLAERLRGADLVLFDGTTWTEDEMLVTGTGTKSASRMGHMAMSGSGGTIAAFANLDIARKAFIHINNTNPVLLHDSAERHQAEAAGWEITYDGMEFPL